MNFGVFVLGIVMVLGGIFIYDYSQAQSIEGLYFAPPINASDGPYSFIGIIIMVVGAVLAIIGVIISTKEKED